MTVSMLDAALSYAERGFRVFPIRPRDKTPLTAHGFKDATTDPTVLRKWLVEKWPSANIAIATGNGIIALDVDPRHGGEESLAALERECGKLPESLEARTGGDGRHLVYATNGHRIHNSAGDLGQGLDIRGDGGYIVVHPSVHASGNRYEWVREVEPAQLPEWLAERLTEPQRSHAPTGARNEDKIPYGQHNTELTRIAGRLRRDGLSEEAMAAALIEVCEQRCDGYGPDYRTMCKNIAKSIGRKVPASQLLTPTRTDTGNAERLLAVYGDQMLYCPHWKKWLIWDRTRWAIDDREHVRDLARDTMRRFGQEALNAEDNVAVKYALKSLDTWKLTNALREAQDQRAVRPSDLDMDPDLLNFTNGTVNLRTGELAAHDPAQRITKIVDCAYDQEAQCPRFAQFINEVVKEGQVPLLLRLLGYSLTGHTTEKVNAVCWGPTDSGKTTLLELICDLLAGYSQVIKAESLMEHKHPDANAMSDLADLCGARFAMTSETGEKARLDEATLKRITPGRGSIRGGRKYQLPFTFTATHKLWFDSNHQLVITTTGDDVWNRLLVFAFGPSIPTDKKDPTLPDKLRKEKDGIVALLCSEAKLWYAEGLGKKLPDKVCETRTEWRTNADRVQRFIEEQCDVGDGYSAFPRALYVRYYDWEKAGHEDAMTETAFGTRLKEKGYEQRRDTKGRKVYLRVKLKS